ncbi:hypothetical protein D0861_01678 [Hortaea werneckii]|uniref:Uncharacterized protein n=1 Tax=Hortaea werneckii TaxID=91943 RepID=A0A3M7FZB6_HORWE|nr:hypothetical protein D0861_01678 [Hortaea werneckii]
MEACVSGYKNIAHHAGALAKFQDGPFEEIEQLGLQLLDDLVQEDEVLDFPRLGLDCLHTRVIGNEELKGPVRDGADASEEAPAAAPKFKKVVTRIAKESDAIVVWRQYGECEIHQGAFLPQHRGFLLSSPTGLNNPKKRL